MALTLTRIRGTIVGSKRVSVYDVDFDASYPAGGESLTAANLGLHAIDLVLASPDSGLLFQYDYANSKLLAYEQGFTTGSTAAADSTSGALVENFAGAETVIRAMGTAIDTTYRFGALKEVADTTDLSSVTDVRVFAIGD